MICRAASSGILTSSIARSGSHSRARATALHAVPRLAHLVAACEGASQVEADDCLVFGDQFAWRHPCRIVEQEGGVAGRMEYIAPGRFFMVFESGALALVGASEGSFRGTEIVDRAVILVAALHAARCGGADLDASTVALRLLHFRADVYRRGVSYEVSLGCRASPR